MKLASPQTVTTQFFGKRQKIYLLKVSVAEEEKHNLDSVKAARKQQQAGLVFESRRCYRKVRDCHPFGQEVLLIKIAGTCAKTVSVEVKVLKS